MLRIEPLGADIVLPAIVVGYEFEVDAQRAVERYDRAEDWILTLDQQAGGLSMWYPSVVGVVLRLADQTPTHGDLPSLVRGLRAMAEDPDLSLLDREFPLLRKLVLTHGSNYSPEELSRLTSFLRSYLWPLPGLESGTEAFVRFEACNLLDHFRGWRILRATPRAPRRIYTDRRVDIYDDSTIGRLQFAVAAEFDERTMAELQQLRIRGGFAEPRAFLLWENSD